MTQTLETTAAPRGCGRIDAAGNASLAGQCPVCQIGEDYACRAFWDVAPPVSCHCHACNRVQWMHPFAPRRFVVCPNCGNKRCPKADDHVFACTGSNEPGQVGVIERQRPERKPWSTPRVTEIAAAEPAPEPAEWRTCAWAGGNDTCYCRTCGEEYRYGREPRPACPLKKESNVLRRA